MASTRCCISRVRNYFTALCSGFMLLRVEWFCWSYRVILKKHTLEFVAWFSYEFFTSVSYEKRFPVVLSYLGCIPLGFHILVRCWYDVKQGHWSTKRLFEQITKKNSQNHWWLGGGRQDVSTLVLMFEQWLVQCGLLILLRHLKKIYMLCMEWVKPILVEVGAPILFLYAIR